MSLQMYVKAMSFKVGNPIKKLVLVNMADECGDDKECRPSLEFIAKNSEISVDEVKKCISELIEDGLIKCEGEVTEFVGKERRVVKSTVYTFKI